MAKGGNMAISGDGKEEPMQVNLTRERVTESIITNLIQVGVLLRSEAARYRKVLATYDNTTLLKVMIHTNELKEDGGGEIITS